MVKLAKNSNRSEFTSKFSLELGSEFKLQFADRERSKAVSILINRIFDFVILILFAPTDAVSILIKYSFDVG